MTADRIARVDMDVRSPESAPDSTAADPRIEPIDCYDLPHTDLSGFAGVIVAGMVDQEFLLRHADRIVDYLAGGGVLVFGGHLHRRWLPGASPFVPLPDRRLADYRVAEVAEHPLFAGVSADELTFRRGVAGFFARGHHPPPPGAEVLVRLAGGQPATYLDRASTAGTILVQATSDPLATHGTRLTDWIIAERARLMTTRTGPGRAGLAAVYGGSSWHHRALTEPRHARHLDGGLLYLPELAEHDLTGYRGLLIPERLHRGLLTRAAPGIRALLDTGGLVAAFSGGEPIPEFLPGTRWTHRPTNYWWWLEQGADLGLRTPRPDHPLWRHLALADCTWHYHGVLDPPDGAEVLVTLPSGEALLYLDRVSTAGTLVVSTLDPLSHYGGHFMPATERFLSGFLPWLAEETTQLTSRGSGPIR